MIREIKHVIKEKLAESDGITFSQHNHEGVESSKVAKLQSFMLQFVK